VVSKSEAEAHGDWAVMISEEVLENVLNVFQAEVIDVLVALNFGSEYKAKISTTGLDGKKLQLLQDLAIAFYTNPMNAEELDRDIDMDKIREIVGLPSNEEE